ncbi:MAG: GntR family transcriptional regulator [Herminiimonas sp.]|nr:GntR family transcriptional regulator [Herminiimonas sp.]MDB5855542.1 GntR family transcriptional regulator [Herminiimonas sp.]
MPLPARPSASPAVAKLTPASLADSAYTELKRDIFEFRMLPGDRFSESEIAARLGMSRTPVRDALSRLLREGFLEVQLRSGWMVKTIDFEQFEHLYDLRLVLETTAVRRLCVVLASQPRREGPLAGLGTLEALWLVPPPGAAQRVDLPDLDEQFHSTLVRVAGNPEMARVHGEVTDRIRMLRRLDFSSDMRCQRTCEEHAAILQAIMECRGDDAVALVRSHIDASKAQVRQISLHKLWAARRATRQSD